MVNTTLSSLQKNLTRRDALAVLRNFFRAFAILLAGLHAWAAVTSQSMNADGISYLDIGDAYFRGDWANAINPVWPPLYSWVLGLVNVIVRPPMEWEFPTVQLVNFAIYLGTLACFEFLWNRLWKDLKTRTADGTITLPGWAWWALGYCLFIWTSLNLIQIWSVTPDLLMAGLVYLAAGLLVDIRANPRRWAPYLLLGLILGLGYLAKTFMFSIALVFLGLCLALIPRGGRSAARVGAAAAIFLLICLPYIGLISNAKGKLTIGEAGTVTYLRYVHGIPFPHWQGDPARGIVPDHPSRLVHQNPPIYSFGSPVGGTYPISTDPSYWFDGIRLPFNAGNQLARLLVGLMFYLELFFKQQGILVACAAALFLLGTREKRSWLALLQDWMLVIPAVVAFGLYALVLVSGRYIGVFVLLFWAGVLPNLRLKSAARNVTVINVLSAVAITGLLVNIALFNLDGITRLNPTMEANIGEPATFAPAKPYEVAQALQQAGVLAGEQVAIIGYGFDSFWARLARVKIVAEMLDTQAGDFWTGDDTVRQSALRAFASTGAKAVVAENVPAGTDMDGWQQIGQSNYYLYRIED